MSLFDAGTEMTAWLNIYLAVLPAVASRSGWTDPRAIANAAGVIAEKALKIAKARAEAMETSDE